jgi:hypothetical protein
MILPSRVDGKDPSRKSHSPVRPNSQQHRLQELSLKGTSKFHCIPSTVRMLTNEFIGIRSQKQTKERNYSTECKGALTGSCR